MTKDRKNWDAYFMDIASAVSTRATCNRRLVGAVIVKERAILSTGYNGSISGLPHCDDDGHDMEDGHCQRTLHAESNAIIQSAKNGVNINGADIYITTFPCWNCFKMIVNAGLKRIFYRDMYGNTSTKVLSAALTLNIPISAIP